MTSLGLIVTDLCMMKPDPETKKFEVAALRISRNGRRAHKRNS